jgi:CheY-like chemotaxis protein
MPDMDGFELARRIRSNNDWSSIRLIAISAGSLSDGESEQQLFDAFLQKPVTLAKLRQILSR